MSCRVFMLHFYSEDSYFERPAWDFRLNKFEKGSNDLYLKNK